LRQQAGRVMAVSSATRFITINFDVMREVLRNRPKEGSLDV